MRKGTRLTARITIIEAKILVNVSKFGGMSPYCKIESPKRTLHITKTGKGTNPKWNETFSFDFEKETTIKISILHKSFFGDTEIGETLIKIPGEANFEYQEWYILKFPPGQSSQQHPGNMLIYFSVSNEGNQGIPVHTEPSLSIDPPSVLGVPIEVNPSYSNRESGSRLPLYASKAHSNTNSQDCGGKRLTEENSREGPREEMIILKQLYHEKKQGEGMGLMGAQGSHGGHSTQLRESSTAALSVAEELPMGDTLPGSINYHYDSHDVVQLERMRHELSEENLRNRIQDERASKMLEDIRKEGSQLERNKQRMKQEIKNVERQKECIVRERKKLKKEEEVFEEDREELEYQKEQIQIEFLRLRQEQHKEELRKKVDDIKYEKLIMTSNNLEEDKQRIRERQQLIEQREAEFSLRTAICHRQTFIQSPQILKAPRFKRRAINNDEPEVVEVEDIVDMGLNLNLNNNKWGGLGREIPQLGVLRRGGATASYELIYSQHENNLSGESSSNLQSSHISSDLGPNKHSPLSSKPFSPSSRGKLAQVTQVKLPDVDDIIARDSLRESVVDGDREALAREWQEVEMVRNRLGEKEKQLQRNCEKYLVDIEKLKYEKDYLEKDRQQLSKMQEDLTGEIARVKREQNLEIEVKGVRETSGGNGINVDNGYNGDNGDTENRNNTNNTNNINNISNMSHHVPRSLEEIIHPYALEEEESGEEMDSVEKWIVDGLEKNKDRKKMLEIVAMAGKGGRQPGSSIPSDILARGRDRDTPKENDRHRALTHENPIILKDHGPVEDTVLVDTGTVVVDKGTGIVMDPGNTDTDLDINLPENVNKNVEGGNMGSNNSGEDMEFVYDPNFLCKLNAQMEENDANHMKQSHSEAEDVESNRLDELALQLQPSAFYGGGDQDEGEDEGERKGEGEREGEDEGEGKGEGERESESESERERERNGEREREREYNESLREREAEEPERGIYISTNPAPFSREFMDAHMDIGEKTSTRTKSFPLLHYYLPLTTSYTQNQSPTNPQQLDLELHTTNSLEPINLREEDDNLQPQIHRISNVGAPWPKPIIKTIGPLQFFTYPEEDDEDLFHGNVRVKLDATGNVYDMIDKAKYGIRSLLNQFIYYSIFTRNL